MATVKENNLSTWHTELGRNNSIMNGHNSQLITKYCHLMMFTPKTQHFQHFCSVLRDSQLHMIWSNRFKGKYLSWGEMGCQVFDLNPVHSFIRAFYFWSRLNSSVQRAGERPDGVRRRMQPGEQEGGHQPNTSCMSDHRSRCCPAGKAAAQHGAAGDAGVLQVNAPLEPKRGRERGGYMGALLKSKVLRIS